MHFSISVSFTRNCVQNAKEHDTCNNEFEVGQALACYERGIYPKHERMYVASICSKVNQQHDHQLTRYKPKTLSS